MHGQPQRAKWLSPRIVERPPRSSIYISLSPHGIVKTLAQIGAETYAEIPAMMTARTPPPSPCVDFLVVGEADWTGGLSFADIGTSLLNHNPTRAQVRPVVMTSNNAKSQHFYLRHATGTLCSVALSSRDIAWMEQTSGLKAGALFKAFKQAASAGAPSVRQLA